jgi:hypothetical protein
VCVCVCVYAGERDGHEAVNAAAQLEIILRLLWRQHRLLRSL